MATGLLYVFLAPSWARLHFVWIFDPYDGHLLDPAEYLVRQVLATVLVSMTILAVSWTVFLLARRGRLSGLASRMRALLSGDPGAPTAADLAFVAVAASASGFVLYLAASLAAETLYS
ncbi:MAG: hypothetical protein MPI95_03080 [Nitrosopumilus sp.]|nr:hypothetical protein [Nitrosopumilus sp.]MDA7944708.1 hypothetical protein [Nitrosopumilus sp.]MDA7952870.1 hypothetical protein [Nitrosopumilus sp.]MDA7958060.1 hypothetical protein [Nitrosopumilus sp.]MDA7960131.1 hypothetical protein [Nitrosopumilus sp.]